MATPTLQTVPVSVWLEELLAAKPELLKDMEEPEVGEAVQHYLLAAIFHFCVAAFLKSRPPLEVFTNLFFYPTPTPGPEGPRHFACDGMIVEPTLRTHERLTSYHAGIDGPMPLFVLEVLSQSTARGRDLDGKVDLYARLGIPEYVLVDPWGEFMPERLLLKRLQPDGSWLDEQDDDGGVTSQLGFRLRFEDDLLELYDAETGKRFARPQEAHALALEREEEAIARQLEAKARQVAEEALIEAHEENARIEAARRAEAELRRQAEEEVARLRAELHRRQSENEDETTNPA